MNPRGRFITLEGGEGAGKSTAARYIRQWLAERGREAIVTREPGGSPLGEAIRSIVLGEWEERMPVTAEVLLMFAARAAHMQNTILPALAAGKDVICDRFVDSTYAYQGCGHGFPESYLQSLEAMVLKNLVPDLTIVFDIDPAAGLERTARRGEQNRFESETASFMGRVRQAFLDRAHAQPGRYAVINAGQALDVVQAALAGVLESRL